jgi:formate dehydrogenase iron-sulfur subunit
VGQAPACAKACPTQAIYFGSKEDMVEHAQGRIADLKERGYANAGLYDPEGVGGTHVMYVLHHNDRPDLYTGLPKSPQIADSVAFWKGGFKPWSLGAIALAAVVGFFHYVAKGPNEVTAEDEENADRLAGRS